MVIFKYEFETDAINAPNGKVLLVSQRQDGVTLPTIWIEHSSAASRTEMLYFLRGTGETIHPDSNAEHVGSAVCGPFVWHVYRRAV